MTIFAPLPGESSRQSSPLGHPFALALGWIPWNAVTGSEDGSASLGGRDEADLVDHLRLAVLIRLALGGNLPDQHRLGDAWFDRRDAGRVAARYRDLPPFKDVPAGAHRLAADDALRAVSKGLLAWLPERASELPPGLGLKSEELALAQLLAREVVFGGDAMLSRLQGYELVDGNGRFLRTIKPDTAARWRVSACTTIADFLLSNRRSRLEGRSVDRKLRRYLLGGWTDLRASDGRLLEEYGLRSLATNDEIPPYVSRDADDAIRSRLRASLRDRASPWERLVVVAGPPKSGKTRSVLEALRTVSGEWRPERVRVLPVRTPAGGDVPIRLLTTQSASLREFYGDDTIVLLVDDLHAHLLTGLLPRQDLGDVLAADGGVVVVATIHDEVLVEGLPTHGYSDVDVQLLRSRSVLIEPELSAQEFARARDRLAEYIDVEFEGSELRRLPELLAAVRSITGLANQARTAEEATPENAAMVEAAIDAAMCHATFTTEQLRRCWNLWFMTTAPGLQRETERRFEAALVWSETRFGRSQLISWTGSSPVRGRVHDRSLEILLASHRSHDELASVLTREELAAGGTAYIQRGREDDAFALLRPAAEAGDSRAMTNLAIMFEQKDDLEVAKMWNERAVEAGSLNATSNLGFVHQRLGDLTEAEIWYRRAAELGEPQAMHNLALVLEETGDDDQALRWFESAAEAGHLFATVNLANRLANLQRFDEAERWFRKAIAEGDADAKFNLGALLFRLGRRNEAEPLLEGAANASHSKAMVHLARLLQASHRLPEARQWLESAVRNGHESAEFELALLNGDEVLATSLQARAAEAFCPEAMYRQGRDIHEAGQVTQAVDWLVKAARSGHPEAAAWLGQVMEAQGRATDAISLYRTAAEAGRVDSYLQLGAALAKQGDIVSAREAFERAASAGLAAGAFNLGLLSEQEGKSQEARAWYRQASDDGITEATANLAMLLLADGEKADAEDLLLQAAEAGHEGAVDWLFANYVEAGRLDEAERWSRRAAANGDAVAASNLGVVLEMLGRSREAILAYEDAVEAGFAPALDNLCNLLAALNEEERLQYWLTRARERGVEGSAADR